MTDKELDAWQNFLDKIAEVQDETEETEEKSECCGAEYVGETDLCSECLEHTGREN